jgi:hypothetical protein
VPQSTHILQKTSYLPFLHFFVSGHQRAKRASPVPLPTSSLVSALIRPLSCQELLLFAISFSRFRFPLALPHVMNDESSLIQSILTYTAET